MNLRFIVRLVFLALSAAIAAGEQLRRRKLFSTTGATSTNPDGEAAAIAANPVPRSTYAEHNGTRHIRRRDAPGQGSKLHRGHRPSTLIILTYWDPIRPDGRWGDEDWRRINLLFFLDQGIVPHHEYHFVIVMQGCYQIRIEPRPNLEVLERANTCFDAGGWLDALRMMAERGRRFEHYVLLNGSVRGPFLPTWARRDWVAALTSPLQGPVKLVGTSVNCWFLNPGSRNIGDNLHVQSMLLATDHEGIETCIRPVMENPPCPAADAGEKWDKDAVIINRELQFTGCILRKGYSAFSTELGFSGVNISESNREEVMRRCAELNPDPMPTHWDNFYPGRYGAHNIDFNPLELMFFKVNRGVGEAYIQSYTDWVTPELAKPDASAAFMLDEPRGIGCWPQRAIR